ncbi:TetR family transcriptional regulator [Mycetocola tolaasinivorans]|uniref:TetR family transcriptional regulator n=1 Tax=Mycetocola tolaasinivorans TaxID=76635 RepID=A0A3L7AAS9_9MICO|nr:TetR family transcriptional regulator [Mycetocola tolaasinivorans]RLP77413.1 TetR family transcriptional regulator [Mycetocola tolaasinivorans]
MTTPTTQERREQMIAAAATLLIAEGPRAITHRRVAETAGIPAGSANYLFPTRRELYAAAVTSAEGVRTAAATAVAQALPRVDRGPEDTALLLLETWYAPHTDPDLVRIRLQPMLEAGADPELREIMTASRPSLLAALDTVLDRSGFGGAGETELIAQMLDASLLYAVGTGAADPRAQAAAQVARLLVLLRRASRDAGSATENIR